MKNGPFEDVFPIGHGIFHSYDSLPKGTPKKVEKNVWPISKTSIMTSIVVHQRKPVRACWNAGSSTSLLIPRDSKTYPTFIQWHSLDQHQHHHHHHHYHHHHHHHQTLTLSTPFIIIPYPLHLASAFFHLDPISCGRSFNGWNAGFGASSITPKWKPSSSSSEPSPGQKPSNILGQKCNRTVLKIKTTSHLFKSKHIAYSITSY